MTIGAVLSVAFARYAMADGPYIRGDGGAMFWSNHENGDEPELEQDAQAAASLEVGYQFENVAGPLDVAVGVNAMWIDAATHGGPDTIIFDPECECERVKDGTEGDGNGFVVPITVNVWPGVSWEDFDLYAGGGLGPAYTEAFDEGDWRLGLLAGAGAYYNVTEDWDLHLGYRHLWVRGSDHQGHVGLLGARFKF